MGVTQIALACAFVVLTVGYGRRAVTAGPAVQRISHVARAGMSAAMAAMFGPWSTALPIQAGVAIFTTAALWFCYLGVFGPRGGCAHPGFEAVKMTAMVWMIVAMSPAATRPVVAAAAATHTMPGMSTHEMSTNGHGVAAATMASPPAWSVVISGCFVVILLIGLGMHLRHRTPATRADDVMGATMAIGMAVSFLLLCD